MPKTAIDYSNTIIYKLINYDCPENVYVGSTTNWTKRKQSHKHGATNSKYKGYNGKVYKIIRENGGWESWNMIEIKRFACANKRDAEAEEDKIMQELKANMNSCRSYVTKTDIKDYMKQYADDNKETIMEYKKNYYHENKKIIKVKQKKYCELNKTKMSENKKAYYESHKEGIKQYNDAYREANKDAIKDKKKLYIEVNKEAIKEKKAIKYTCECGLTCCKDHKARHERSKKHINYLNSLELNE